MKKIGVEVGSEAPREFYSCIVHIKINNNNKIHLGQKLFTK